MSDTPNSATRPSVLWAARAVSLAEVLLVLVGGGILAQRLRGAIGLPAYKALLADPSDAPVDFVWLSGVVTSELCIKFGVMLGIALLVTWLRGRFSFAALGLTTGGHGFAHLAVVGWVLFAVTFPVKSLLLLNDYISLGEGAAHWWIFELPWTPAFWLFMAVSSFVLPPIFEELLVRGYMQTRLAEVFGARTAILLIAALFALAHGQYHHASPLSVGMLVSIFLGSICLGYVFLRTGSLIPCIIAHSLGNIPTSSMANFFLIPLMVLTVVVAWKPILRFAMDFLGRPRSRPELPVDDD